MENTKVIELGTQCSALCSGKSHSASLNVILLLQSILEVSKETRDIIKEHIKEECEQILFKKEQEELQNIYMEGKDSGWKY